MTFLIEATCIVCQRVFCCADCRWNHEKLTHGLLFDCPICRGQSYLCNPELLTQHFIQHLLEEHSPLQCKKCKKMYTDMEDLNNVDKCHSISELLSNETDKRTSIIDEKFDSIYEKIVNTEPENIEAIVSVNKINRTAVITPIVRKQNLVDYGSSDSENEDKVDQMRTPHPKMAPKTPRSKRVATPHVKKLLVLMRQKVIEDSEEPIEEQGQLNGFSNNKITPSRNVDEAMPETPPVTTPTSHMQILKLAKAVSTSTPTNTAGIQGWSMFDSQGADSPLSEIENADSPAQINNEPLKSEIPLKLKSIIVTGSKLKLGSQDSSEKQVTFQDSDNIIEDTSSKIKKVKFADDTVFEQESKMKRVFHKPKRMLTPGPQKPKLCYNPRFQALINRFETNKSITMARTPVHSNREKVPDSTPPVGEHLIKPARAIDFKEDSPVVEVDYSSKECTDLYKTCEDDAAVPNPLTQLTTNIASTLQTCLTSVLQANDEETEIQFKFVITKKRVSVKRVADNGVTAEKQNEIEGESDTNKENIWHSVAKAVKNVFWGDQGNNLATPCRPYDTINTTASSGSKRKCDQMTDSDLSPLNHKRHKYSGRIRGRPPLRRTKTSSVSQLRSSQSEDLSHLNYSF